MGKVLIVDDEELMRHSLGVLITRKGHKTIEWPGSTGIGTARQRGRKGRAQVAMSGSDS